jgi:hypothetical protein
MLRVLTQASDSLCGSEMTGFAREKMMEVQADAVKGCFQDGQTAKARSGNRVQSRPFWAVAASRPGAQRRRSIYITANNTLTTKSRSRALGLGSVPLAFGMRAATINIRDFFHGRALRAAILIVQHFAGAVRVGALLEIRWHVVPPSFS